ncbi:hypothetical protein F4225_15370 [Candidatus Poribacteria bacterium]|nr:hypothetical protein [Candidatus Poribacteria bacterium]
MKSRMKWGVAILIGLLIGVSVFLLTRSTETEPEEVYRAPTPSEQEQVDRNIQDAIDKAKKDLPPIAEIEHQEMPNKNSQQNGSVESVTVEDTERNTGQIGVDWNSLSLQERRRRWAIDYRAKWGDDPPWNAEYRHVHDSKGKVRRHYRNKSLVVDYEIRKGFAPTPAGLERYMTLKGNYHKAESAGDSLKANTHLREMQEFVDNNQGEIPVHPFGITYYGKPITQDVQRQLNADAVKELYTFMGITHLYEFYEK